LDVPGRQSTKYSPISDCGRVSQNDVRAQRAEAGLVVISMLDERALVAVELQAR
jgi:hypothetical protein